jgi:hypothetical protein
MHATDDDSDRDHPAILWRNAMRLPNKIVMKLAPGAELGPTARHVGLAMSFYVNRASELWPGAARLARETALSERSVRQQIERLNEAGWLSKITQGGVKGGARLTRWRATTPEPLAGVTAHDPGTTFTGTEERAATVTGPTPERHAPTPEPPSYDPGTSCHREGKEQVQREGHQPTPLEIATSLVESHHDELPALIDEHTAKYGAPLLHAALLELTRTHRQVKFPSALRAALSGPLSNAIAERAQRKIQETQDYLDQFDAFGAELAAEAESAS